LTTMLCIKHLGKCSDAVRCPLWVNMIGERRRAAGG
jgi:hypothetical protein